jgi:hypothetical protein
MNQKTFNQEQIQQPEFLTFNSLEDLTSLLAEYSIDTTNWKKSPAQLFKEIQIGESALAINPSKRGVERHTNAVMVCVISPDGTEQIMETRQDYHDGRPSNMRQIPLLGEKLIPKENQAQGCKRAIVEELLGDRVVDEGLLVPQRLAVKLPTKSPTYSGFIDKAKVGSFEIRMPEAYYNPNGYTEIQLDKGKTNVFEWVPRYIITNENLFWVCEALDRLEVKYTISHPNLDVEQFAIAIGDKKVSLETSQDNPKVDLKQNYEKGFLVKTIEDMNQRSRQGWSNPTQKTNQTVEIVIEGSEDIKTIRFSKQDQINYEKPN